MIDLSYPTRPLHPDVTLANGRKVKHRYLSNGAQSAEIGPGINAFSEAELAEYDRIRNWDVVGR
jgi:hypothetical protein